MGEISTVLPVFESISLHQFEAAIGDEQHKHARLFQTKAVRSTLAAIDRADTAEALEGHERLAVLQNVLVDLLAYIETTEGFSVSIGERRKARTKGSHVWVSPTQPAKARILHQSPGRIRLGILRLKTDKAYADGLQSLLRSVENVTSIHVNEVASCVTICFSPDIAEAEFARIVMKTIEEGFSAA